jgi:hypothetical protein
MRCAFTPAGPFRLLGVLGRLVRWIYNHNNYNHILFRIFFLYSGCLICDCLLIGGDFVFKALLLL